MSIEFYCVSCRRRLRVGDDAEGRQAKCPHCGAIMTVPTIVRAEPSDSSGAAAFGAGSAPPPPPPGPGTAYHPRTPVLPDIPSYLAQAILCTLLCCLPFGIVAIVYAAQVHTKLASGDYHGALAASNSARTWCWVSFWCGLIASVGYLGLMMVAAMARG